VLWDYGIFFDTFTHSESSNSVCASSGGDVCLQPSCKYLIHLNDSLQWTQEAFWYKSVTNNNKCFTWFCACFCTYFKKKSLNMYYIKNFPKQYVTFLITEPTRCTILPKYSILEWNSTRFGQFLRPSSGVLHCTHSNGIRHTGLLTACEQDQDGILILLTSCQQPCMTHTIAVRTVENSWWQTEELSKTCRVSFQNGIFWEVGASSWLYYKKFITLHGYMNVKAVHNNNNACSILCPTQYPPIHFTYFKMNHQQ